jgi:hypothetical protein
MHPASTAGCQPKVVLEEPEAPTQSRRAGCVVSPMDIIGQLQNQRANIKEARKEHASEEDKCDDPTATAEAAAPTVLRRPAGAGQTKQTVMKKPVAAKKLVAKKPANEAESSCPLSHKRRLQLRPHGCSKCRRRPGCTPSCWRGIWDRCLTCVV